MIWMIVSKDKYEFPLGVYDTATELAMAVGTSANCVMATVNKFEKGKLGKGHPWGCPFLYYYIGKKAYINRKGCAKLHSLSLDRYIRKY